jgi:anaerobic selenocysteine-containing dehydrogenase
MKPGEDGTHLRTCPLCEAMCGLEIHVEGGPESGKVTSIRGNRDDVWSRGHLCPKGTSLAALHDDPDRIRQPMIKVDGQWREASWDAAFRRCTELLTTNVLSPPTFVDEPSGNGVLNGIPVTIIDDQARFRRAPTT